MDFEAPVIIRMTTADSPACLRAADQDDSKDGRPTSSSCFTLCSLPCACLAPCRCECLCPLPCRCECMCPLPCKCQLPCTCECICPSPCPCQYPFAASTRVESPGEAQPATIQALRLATNIRLRREQTGGLLFDVDDFGAYLCNPTAYAVLHRIESCSSFTENDIAELITDLAGLFDELPDDAEPLIRQFLCSCVRHFFLEAA